MVEAVRVVGPRRVSKAEGAVPPGTKAIIRHVDDFRPVHNLESLGQLTAALGRLGPRREEGLTTWQGMAA